MTSISKTTSDYIRVSTGKQVHYTKQTQNGSRHPYAKRLDVRVSPGIPFDPNRAQERREANGGRDSALRP